MMRFAYVIALIGILPVSMLKVIGNEPASEAMQEKLIAKQELVQTRFGDIYAAWDNESLDADGNTTKQRIELWSREGKYYRIDRTDLIDGQPVGAVFRCIVRPEGFVKIAAKTASKPGAVIEFGPATEGIDYVEGSRFFCTACRDSTLVPVYQNVSDLMDGQFQKKRPWAKDPTYAVEVTPDGTIGAKYSFGSGEDTSTGSAVLDGKTFFVTSASSKSSVSKGAGSHRSIINTYDDDSPIPLTSLAELTWDDGIKEFDHLTLTEVTFEPAPIDVFAIDGFDKNRNETAYVWWRRLIVAGIGVLLTSIYFRYRNQSGAKNG